MKRLGSWKGLILLTGFLPVLGCLSCGKSGSSSSSNNATSTNLPGTALPTKSDSGGVVTASLAANTTSAQLLKASSSSKVKGAQASFPAGALTIKADVSIQQADSLASGTSNAMLGITGASDVTAASKTVLVSASPLVTPSKPFTLQIPVSTSLALASSTHLSVLYRIQKQGSSDYFIGFLDSSKFVVKSTYVNITASYFGAYQVVHVSDSLGKISEAEGLIPFVGLNQIFPINGTWATSCQPCRNNVSNCYEIDTLTSSGSSIILELDHFTDSNCYLQGDKWLNYSTYVVGSSVSSPSGGTAANIYSAKYFITALTTTAATLFNSESLCGLTNWSANTTQNVTGLVCNSSSPTSTSARIIYSNYVVTSSKLLPGVPVSSSVDDGTTEAKRMLGSDSYVFKAQ